MQSKKTIGLVQINNSFSGQSYFPYSVGILQAYAQKYLADGDSLHFLPAIYKRVPTEAALRQLAPADIVFFSTYTWNVRNSLAIAGHIKKNKPGALIVFGGPEVPNNGEGFLKANSFVDILCHGEGEKPFLGILENYNRGDWGKVPSITFRDKGGKIERTALAPRISNLEEVPSPYLSGVFDSLMKANPHENWIGLWETNRGCPFSCSYCFWGAPALRRVYTHNIEKLYGEIDWFSQHAIEFIFCCDANFGIMPRDIDIVKRFAANKAKYSFPKALSVQNTKNSTARICEMYRIMSEAKLSKGVSLAIQSLNPGTLKAIKRENISIDSFNDLQKRFNEETVETFTDVILGLPCETYDSFVNGISSLIENGQHNRIQFINLSILTNAEMDSPEYQKKYGFRSVEARLINIHGQLEDSEVPETQRLVIETNTMPAADWVKTRVFGWVTSLLYFNKLLQIPLAVLNSGYSISFRDLLEVFTSKEAASHPVLSGILSLFTEKARDIQKGGPEYCESKKWLNIWWPPDELVMIDLCAENKLADFYREAGLLLGGFLQEKKLSDSQPVLADAMLLNRSLIKVPFQSDNLKLRLSHNIWEVYRGRLAGKKLELVGKSAQYEIDRRSNHWSSWEQWCREVIWWGNKKGAYLYDCREINGETGK